ncbi:MAG: FkbM family methyltransferase [Verrucomicrobiales bacterium]|jgi:FkbM family methyltransferase
MNRLSSLKSAFLKPEFIFRPSQIFKRLQWNSRWQGQTGTVELPWGLPLEVDARETIGQAITKIGVYDLIVPEAIFRLCDEGETALDIGANIGMTVGAMALAAGNAGKVIAFEPHPKLNAGLGGTIANWKKNNGITNIELRAKAISDQSGTAALNIPTDFGHNTGSASLSASHFEDASQVENIDVPVTTLDEAFPDPLDKIGVLKIDIEGHEHPAFVGAERLLSVGCIRDIIFEEYEPLPTPVTRLLQKHGYTIFLLRKDLLRPTLVPIPCGRPPMLPNYLATLDPDRAIKRFKKRGFLSLKTHPSQTS